MHYLRFIFKYGDHIIKILAYWGHVMLILFTIIIYNSTEKVFDTY